MSNDLNLCQFIGRLGNDPEIRYTTSGDAVASFSIAVGSQWKDKATGDKKEATEWVNCSAFGKLAEIIGEYVKKGQHVYLAGRWRTEKWQDKEGKDRYSTKLMVDSMQMLGSKRDGEASGAANPCTGHSAPSSDRKAPAPAGNNSFDNFDDDLPF